MRKSQLVIGPPKPLEALVKPYLYLFTLPNRWGLLMQPQCWTIRLTKFETVV